MENIIYSEHTTNLVNNHVKKKDYIAPTIDILISKTITKSGFSPGTDGGGLCSCGCHS